MTNEKYKGNREPQEDYVGPQYQPPTEVGREKSLEGLEFNFEYCGKLSEEASKALRRLMNRPTTLRD